MNINSLWKSKRKHSRSSRSRASSCVGSTLGQEPECFHIQRRMEQFDKLLLAETVRIQDHLDQLSELRCELRADCTCRQRFERQLAKMEKKVLRLRGEMQEVRKTLLDSDCYLHQNEQRQREMQHRLQELWNLMTEYCEFGEVELQSGRPVKVITTTKTAPAVTIESPAATSTGQSAAP